MNVGWIEKTVAGIRLFESKRGRYFRDPASARARETVVARATRRERGCASQRRDTYLLAYQHLDWSGPRAVRNSWQFPDDAA